MKCSLSTFYGYVALAIGLLVGASTATFFWITAFPLFAAAAAVAVVAYWVIPEIKNALIQYGECRGPPGKCPPINLAIDTLGQVAATLSVISFTLAGALQLSALAFIASWVLAFIGVSMEVAVQYLVWSGRVSCWVAIGILLGVLTNAIGFADCMDQQEKSGGPTNVGSGANTAQQ